MTTDQYSRFPETPPSYGGEAVGDGLQKKSSFQSDPIEAWIPFHFDFSSFGRCSSVKALIFSPYLPLILFPCFFSSFLSFSFPFFLSRRMACIDVLEWLNFDINGAR